jgi:plasmid stabilization system protein ParE
MHEYLLMRNPSAADTVTASIRSIISRLQEMPRLGRMADEKRVRVLIEPVYGYRTFYSIDDQDVFVIRILHGHRRARAREEFPE